MAQRPTNWLDEIGIAAENLRDSAGGMFTPTIRLGVTGLSRAGKTIFITSLVHNLIAGTRMPLFGAMAEGRLIGAQLAEQPDDQVPRFAYEKHLEDLTGRDPQWPASTSRVAELRLTLRYQSASWLGSMTGPRAVHLDIVDYPGEWLLDLPLLTKSFSEWSAEALGLARNPPRLKLAGDWLKAVENADPLAEATDTAAEGLAAAFTGYLRACRADEHGLSTLPPGRFLMPGEMEGSPALTFSPLPGPAETPRSNTLYAMMERRYEAYKRHVVKPFFRDHFARLDRQIVLVDALSALNAGPAAVRDLETALTDILRCFRVGDGNPISQLLTRRIDRILFAATKADLLHHTSHDRLEALLGRLVDDAAKRAKFSGARTEAIALSSVRATREGTVKHEGETLPCIIGRPREGEELEGHTYDGKEEIAFFPGDLPQNPESLFQAAEAVSALKFLRFRPPLRDARTSPLPHIRLDRATEFLLGDRLK